MLRVLIVAFMSILAGSGIAESTRRTERVKHYTSPDGAVVASVTFTRTFQDTVESNVVLRSTAGKFLADRSYSSKDGEHGFAVVQAGWTPDSQFFVYSLESSGGHSPWHSPVEYFGRSSNKITALDDALHDAVMHPKFKVSAPDRVTVGLYFSHKEETVSLSALGHTKLH